MSVAAVKAQCFSLLGRLEGLGSGAVTAAGRRRRALERLLAIERKADAMSTRQGYNIVRRVSTFETRTYDVSKHC